MSAGSALVAPTNRLSIYNLPAAVNCGREYNLPVMNAAEELYTTSSQSAARPTAVRQYIRLDSVRNAIVHSRPRPRSVLPLVSHFV